jgi:hypothetical protein
VVGDDLNSRGKCPRELPKTSNGGGAIFCFFLICLIRDKKGIILPSREASSAARGYRLAN